MHIISALVFTSLSLQFLHFTSKVKPGRHADFFPKIVYFLTYSKQAFFSVYLQVLSVAFLCIMNVITYLLYFPHVLFHRDFHYFASLSCCKWSTREPLKQVTMQLYGRLVVSGRNGCMLDHVSVSSVHSRMLFCIDCFSVDSGYLLWGNTGSLSQEVVRNSCKPSY